LLRALYPSSSSARPFQALTLPPCACRQISKWTDAGRLLSQLSPVAVVALHFVLVYLPAKLRNSSNGRGSTSSGNGLPAAAAAAGRVRAAEEVAESTVSPLPPVSQLGDVPSYMFNVMLPSDPAFDAEVSLVYHSFPPVLRPSETGKTSQSQTGRAIYYRPGQAKGRLNGSISTSTGKNLFSRLTKELQKKRMPCLPPPDPSGREWHTLCCSFYFSLLTLRSLPRDFPALPCSCETRRSVAGRRWPTTGRAPRTSTRSSTRG